MMKNKLLRKIFTLSLVAIILIFLWCAFSGRNDSKPNAIFDYKWRPNGSQPDPHRRNDSKPNAIFDYKWTPNGSQPDPHRRNDSEYNATFDYECRPNGSQPDPHILHYCLRGPKIFFLETSESRKLNPRQACAVESTARHNPSMKVSVLMTPSSDIDHSDNFVKAVLSFPNVDLRKIDIDVFVHGTPVWKWLRTGKWKSSNFKVPHISDALRLVVLWKYGGIYLDLDIVTLRSLEKLKNTVITENWETVGSAILIFDRNHELIRRCMEYFALNYDPQSFANNGPAFLTRNLIKFCGVQDVRKVPGSGCGVDVLAPEAGFPIYWDHWEEYLKPIQLNESVSSHFASSYVIHVWNKLSEAGKLIFGNNSLYERAMKENCPSVYKNAMKLKEI